MLAIFNQQMDNLYFQITTYGPEPIPCFLTYLQPLIQLNATFEYDY